MGKEAKANAERGNDKITVDWRAIPLAVYRSDRPFLAAIDEVIPQLTEPEASARFDELLRVRAAKQCVMAYVVAGVAGRMTGRDAQDHWNPLRDDLETDDLDAIILRRHLTWVLRHLVNDELAVPASCAGWREAVYAYLHALVDAPVDPVPESPG